MVNPFDRNFFKFFVGFILVLLASFTMLYFIGRYAEEPLPEAAVVPPTKARVVPPKALPMTGTSIKK